MKGGYVLRTVSFYARNCLLRPPTTITKTPPASSLIPLAASTRTGLSFYSFGRSVPSEFHEKNDGRLVPSEFHEKNDPEDSANEAAGKELKKRVQKYFDGDEDAIPSIFEAILERMLAKLEGKLDVKDVLMEKIFGKREELHGDSEDHKDFESESKSKSKSESESESDSDYHSEEHEDFESESESDSDSESGSDSDELFRDW